MAKLVLSADGTIVFQCFVDDARLTIGRDPGSDVVVDDPAASPAHAVVVAVGKDHILEDLGTAGGTFVNGARVDRHILQHGDVIGFGALSLRYLNPRASAEVDLDRTMLITGLKPVAEVAEEAQRRSAESLRVPSAPATRVRFPDATIRFLRGPRAPGRLPLDRVVAGVGRPGELLAVVVRRPYGFFLCRVEGRGRVRVNGRAIDDAPWQLRDGDVIDVADERVEFIAD